MFSYVYNSQIDNPDIEIQLAAINTNPKAIAFIETQTKELQMAAVKRDPHIINRIQNPHKDVIDYLEKGR